jgi:Death domain
MFKLSPGNMSAVDALTRVKLSKLLDPAKAGSDWRELAKRLKLQLSICGFEAQKSPTKALLDSYEVYLE